MNNDKNAVADYGVLILEGFRGSQAHGTYIPSDDPDSIDDIDYMGIYVMPLDHYLGLDSIPFAGGAVDGGKTIC